MNTLYIGNIFSNILPENKSTIYQINHTYSNGWPYEIFEAIDELKRNKSHGTDNKLNESFIELQKSPC